MASIRVSDDHLHLRLTLKEKIAGLLRNTSVPLTAVEEVRLVENPFGAVRGIRAPGLSIPRRTRVGTWRGRARRSLVVARRREPGLLISLAHPKLTEIIVSLPDAEEVLKEISLRSPGTASAGYSEGVREERGPRQRFSEVGPAGLEPTTSTV